ERERHRDDFALLHEPGGLLDLFWRDVVERPDFVVGPPLAPVSKSLAVVVQQLFGHLGSICHDASHDRSAMQITIRNGPAPGTAPVAPLPKSTRAARYLCPCSWPQPVPSLALPRPSPTPRRRLPASPRSSRRRRP